MYYINVRCYTTTTHISYYVFLCSFFLTFSDVLGMNPNISEAFSSSEFYSRSLGVKESQADLIVQPPLTSDLSLGALIRVRRLSWSSGNTDDVFSLGVCGKKRNPNNNSWSSWSFSPASQSAEVKTNPSSFSQETIMTKIHSSKSSEPSTRYNHTRTVLKSYVAISIFGSLSDHFQFDWFWGLFSPN